MTPDLNAGKDSRKDRRVHRPAPPHVCENRPGFTLSETKTFPGCYDWVVDTGKHHIEEFDAREHYRCPMLGGEVPFRYCRTVTEGKPCRRIEACWGEMMDIRGFLQAHYDQDELREAWNRSKKPKLVSILEILQNVQKKPGAE